MRLGAHLSAAGGVSRAAIAAGELGCGALQVFLRSPGRWLATALTDAEVARFREAVSRSALDGAVFAHAPYLLNLASADRILRRRSTDTLVEELARGGRLGLAGLVLHPGSAGASQRDAAIGRCRDALADALERAGTDACRLLLEGGVGAGGQLGTTPAELRALVREDCLARVGLCLDTAHLWGAGYDLTGDGWERVLDEVATHWRMNAPALIHGNDSPVACGSHRDRHAAPGDGALGRVFFTRLLADERTRHVPLIVEIPPGEKNRDVAKVLKRLRTWSPRVHPSRRRR